MDIYSEAFLLSWRLGMVLTCRYLESDDRARLGITPGCLHNNAENPVIFLPRGAVKIYLHTTFKDQTHR